MSKKNTKSYELINKEIDALLGNEFQKRNILDTKSFSLLGVIVGLLTIIVPEINFPSTFSNIGIYQYIGLSTIGIGFIFSIISIVGLLIGIAPKSHSYINFDELMQYDNEQIEYVKLLAVVNEKNNEILYKYMDVNKVKSKALHIGTVFSIVGIMLIIIGNLLI